MWKRVLTLMLSLLGTMLLVLVAVLPGGWAAPPHEVAAAADLPEHGVLVRFTTAPSSQEMAVVHSHAGGRVKETIPGIGVQVVTVPAGRLEAAIKIYTAHPLVIYAEPDYMVEAVGEPNDPYFGNQWGLHKVEAPAAWSVTTGSASVRIAVLDTGVRPDHPDLEAKILDSVNFTGSPTANDVHGHGTSVAGIAAAGTNNGIGVAGMGYDSSILNVKVLDDDGVGWSSWVAEGIVWAADNGAEVINMSLGSASHSQAMEDAVNYAWNNGVVVVAAAGNDGTSTPYYPAAYANCIAVAATDSTDARASFSNYGDWVNLAAPGVLIYTTRNDGSYGYFSGTSAASPHVAGLAALLFTTLADTSGNGFLNDEVRARIESACDDIGVSGIGSGRINAAGAVGQVHTISGTILDGEGMAVQGVSVAAIGGHEQTMTGNEHGYYELTGVEPGAVDITITPAKPGYTFEPVSRTVAGPMEAGVLNQDFTATADEIPPVDYNLTIDSTGGGSVTVPGEDTFTYEAGTVVDLLAVPHEHYRFVEWTGDIGPIADASSATTTITIEGDYSITANFAEEEPVTYHYHWGPGFPYGATAEVFAVAIVGEDGMEVYWYHDGWAGTALPVGWYHDVYNIDPDSGLPGSGNPATWSDPMKGLFEDHFPGETTVYYARSPVDAGDVPEPDPASVPLEPPVPVTYHYHWGVGFPYGATAEKLAVAIVGEDGMDVWWYHDGWAGTALPVGWYHDVYSINPDSGLPGSGNPATWSDPVKGLFDNHFPGVTTVYYGRSPVDAGDVPEPDPESTLLAVP